jgi:hypothetical protein
MDPFYFDCGAEEVKDAAMSKLELQASHGQKL